jgi:hypothetical protein
MSEPSGSAVLADMQLDVRQRLTQLAEWWAAWQQEDAFLAGQLQDLDPERPRDLQRGVQLAGLRRRLSLKLVGQPLAIAAETVQAVGYPVLRQQMAAQFAGLTKSERLLWLNNFLFILTPDLRQLSDKIAKVRAYRRFGQRRNFLLGGPSGMGKTTFLNWLTLNEMPVMEKQRNHVPVIKIDAPVSNHTPKPLFQRMLQECGATYTMNDNEEVLLMKLILYFQHCGVDLLIVDEVEHITRPELRRRLLELANLTHGAPIICASCHPLRWIEGDSEVQGRWNDYFKLEQYTGQRLSQLLAFLELLLPFTGDSFLASRSVPFGAIAGEYDDGPARLIEQWTGGILQDIMLLLLEASVRAIRQDLTWLSPLLLEESWRAIQTHQVTDFLAVLQRQNLPQVSREGSGR